MEPEFLDEFFAHYTVPAEVELEPIRQEWLALRPPYDPTARHLPLPIWARRPFTESGKEAWQHLNQQVPTLEPSRPFCIYVHIPFCADHCEFCDCYSFRLASHRQAHVERYTELLHQETRLWSDLGTLSRRPVSTIHFGGGTPTCLGPEPFARLVKLFQEHFAIGPETEWALESTVSELSPEMMTHLNELGFTRLHVGVQSLEDPIRRIIHRRAPAHLVLERLVAAIETGWIVSVDLIYGLPGQTLSGLVEDIRSLVAIGVDGFSLYELQVSDRNRRFASRYRLEERDRRLNYLLGQVAARYLLALGYRKTLFNHFAGIQDTNLYFTFPERGEDCLALGTIADGVFGDYHYQHVEYAAYSRQVPTGFPGLGGGLRRNSTENRMQPLVTALMAGRVPLHLAANLVSRFLLQQWQETRLLTPDLATGDLILTGSGSWFLGNMISELMDHAEAWEKETEAGRVP
ncbi:MAG: radical SAM protein [Anaerolineae bacterium]